MNNDELKSKIAQLINQSNENEVIEFKEAKNKFEFEKLGQYFSKIK